MIDLLSSSAGHIALLGAAGAVLVGIYRWLKPRFARLRSKVAAASDAILGREATYDTITGELVQPALPGIGVRMSSTESAVVDLAAVVERLANSSERLDNHEERILRLEGFHASPSTPVAVDVTVNPPHTHQ